MLNKNRLTIRQQSLGHITVVVILLLMMSIPLRLLANDPMTTDNYRLDPNVSNSFGGLVDSDSYQLLNSGGEAVIGLGDSPSYKLSQGYISQLEQSLELSVLPTGLAAYYPLNTGVGIQAYDATHNNNHGVLTDGPTWVGGKVGSRALEFDGNNDRVQIGGFSTPSTSELTMSAWVHQTKTGDFQRVVYNGSGSNAHGFTINDAGQFRFAVNDGGFQTVGTPETLNEWVHYTGVFDSGSLLLYKNGVLVDSANISSSISSYSGLSLGSDVGGGVHFGGRLDEVKVYDRALSDIEVLDEYQASSAGIPSALTLPRIGPDSSQTVGADAIIRTDAGGYNVTIEQDGDLRISDSGPTIPPAPGSISNPETWNEGSTIGFGFTVTQAVQRHSKWGTAPDFAYAAVPNTATVFHSRDGLSSGDKEITALQFRLGVGSTQASGIYSNRLGFTATIKP